MTEIDRTLREETIRQADEWLRSHKKIDTWYLMDRLRDELVRANDAELTIPFTAPADESRERAVELYARGIRAFNLYPPREGGNAHHSAVLGVYEVGVLDGLKQARKDSAS